MKTKKLHYLGSVNGVVAYLSVGEILYKFTISSFLHHSNKHVVNCSKKNVFKFLRELKKKCISTGCPKLFNTKNYLGMGLG